MLQLSLAKQNTEKYPGSIHRGFPKDFMPFLISLIRKGEGRWDIGWGEGEEVIREAKADWKLVLALSFCLCWFGGGKGLGIMGWRDIRGLGWLRGLMEWVKRRERSGRLHFKGRKVDRTFDFFCSDCTDYTHTHTHTHTVWYLNLFSLINIPFFSSVEKYIVYWI